MGGRGAFLKSNIPRYHYIIYIIYIQEKAGMKMVNPFDLFNPYKKKVSDKVLAQRLGICVYCPKYRQKTQQCKECGCIMPLKAKLRDATCPLGKW